MPFEVDGIEYKTLSEAAAELSLIPSTLRSLIRRGDLPDVPLLTYVMREQRGFSEDWIQAARRKLGRG